MFSDEVNQMNPLIIVKEMDTTKDHLPPSLMSNQQLGRPTNGNLTHRSSQTTYTSTSKVGHYLRTMTVTTISDLDFELKLHKSYQQLIAYNKCRWTNCIMLGFRPTC